jgi:hypothetical protein
MALLQLILPTFSQLLGTMALLQLMIPLTIALLLMLPTIIQSLPPLGDLLRLILAISRMDGKRTLALSLKIASYLFIASFPEKLFLRPRGACCGLVRKATTLARNLD